MIQTRSRGEASNRIIIIKPRLSIQDLFTEEPIQNCIEMKTLLEKYLSDPVLG